MSLIVSNLYRGAVGSLVGCLCALVLCGAANGQDTTQAAENWSKDHIWARIDAAGSDDRVEPTSKRQYFDGAEFRLDEGAAKSALIRSPKEPKSGRIHDGLEWSLPMPDGQLKRFLIVESPVMAPELGARFPEIKTYRGIGLDDPNDRIRLDWYRGRLHAQVRRLQGYVYIDPIESSLSDYVAYLAKTAKRSEEDNFECLTDTQVPVASLATSTTSGYQSDGLFRVYRLAMAATGEYTQFHGGTVEAGLAAIVTAVNRLNGIYEAELAIRFQIVADNDKIIFVNAASDPYSNTDATAMLTQNQGCLDAIIGPANYDVGHVFATGGGGLAQLYSVCVSGWKGRGVTGRANPTGDSFYVDYFAHEIGHQFGAHHTFNGITGSCSSQNRHPETAYEPGSGSTIMGYSGLCGMDNLQYSSDPYFHSASLIEIRNFIASGCAPGTSAGNTPPIANAGPDYTIPKGTPFQLTAMGSDADGDVVTYCWEQLDLGAAASLSGQDPGSGPLFRSFPPVHEAVRVFPKLADLISNTASSAEVLPVTTRTLNFRVTVRDNRAGAGAFGMDEMNLNVTTLAGPFAVTWPNTPVELAGEQTVTWDVASTDLAPVSAAFVDIYLSTNGGNTFPILLAEHTPNDGSQTITLPDIYAPQARIQVRASDNVFFDINDVDFNIVPSAASALVVMVQTNLFTNTTSVLIPGSGTKGNASVFPLQIPVSNVEGVVEHVTVQLHGLTHSFLDDLDILLVSPTGEKVVLLSDCGGGASVDNLELAFADEGTVFPSGGIVASGTYQPANIGSTGDSFPLSGPYGTKISAFNEMDPNGVWSLYIVDDSTGDAGSLARGCSLSIQSSYLVPQTNAAPIILAQPRRYVHEGATLVVTNIAMDPDSDDGLTFTLSADVPPGVSMDSSGVLTWLPHSAPAGTTNYCRVTVTDSGTPAMTSEATLEVVVLSDPFIQSINIANQTAHLQWTSIAGSVYRVQCTDDLASETWISSSNAVVADSFTADATWPVGTGGQRFFRVRVEP